MLPGVVQFLLRYTVKRFGSVSQKCLQSNLWLSRLHSCATVAFEIAHLTLPARNHVESFYEWALRLPAENLDLVHFPEWTFARMDSFTNGHFSEWTLTQKDICPNKYWPRGFLDNIGKRRLFLRQPIKGLSQNLLF